MADKLPPHMAFMIRSLYLISAGAVAAAAVVLLLLPHALSLGTLGIVGVLAAAGFTLMGPLLISALRFRRRVHLDADMRR